MPDIPSTLAAQHHETSKLQTVFDQWRCIVYRHRLDTAKLTLAESFHSLCFGIPDKANLQTVADQATYEPASHERSADGHLASTMSKQRQPPEHLGEEPDVTAVMIAADLEGTAADAKATTDARPADTAAHEEAATQFAPKRSLEPAAPLDRSTSEPALLTRQQSDLLSTNPTKPQRKSLMSRLRRTKAAPDPVLGRTASDTSLLTGQPSGDQSQGSSTSPKRRPSGIHSIPTTPQRMSLLGRLSRVRRSNSIVPEPSIAEEAGQMELPQPEQQGSAEQVPDEQPMNEVPFAEQPFPNEPIEAAQPAHQDLPIGHEGLPTESEALPTSDEALPAEDPNALTQAPFADLSPAEQLAAGSSSANKRGTASVPHQVVDQALAEQAAQEQPPAESPLREQLTCKESGIPVGDVGEAALDNSDVGQVYEQSAPEPAVSPVELAASPSEPAESPAESAASPAPASVPASAPAAAVRAADAAPAAAAASDETAPVLPNESGGLGQLPSMSSFNSHSDEVASLHSKMDQLIAAYALASTPRGTYIPESIFAPTPDTRPQAVDTSLTSAVSIAPKHRLSAPGSPGADASQGRATASPAFSPAPGKAMPGSALRLTPLQIPNAAPSAVQATPPKVRFGVMPAADGGACESWDARRVGSRSQG
ncbi:hypothetical protein WJX82_006815 [Trebouxia sp. C0006]